MAPGFRMQRRLLNVTAKQPFDTPLANLMALAKGSMVSLARWCEGGGRRRPAQPEPLHSPRCPGPLALDRGRPPLGPSRRRPPAVALNTSARIRAWESRRGVAPMAFLENGRRPSVARASFVRPGRVLLRVYCHLSMNSIDTQKWSTGGVAWKRRAFRSEGRPEFRRLVLLYRSSLVLAQHV